jgi:predicted AAA+ superfamily ATPase
MHKQDADLSRRAVFYHLDGMSFREYLRLSENINIQQVEYETILKEHEIIAHDIHNTLKSTLKYFKEYLAIGYYPFFLKDFTSFRMKLSNTIQEVLEADLGFVCDIKYGKVHQLKKLLYMLANTPPYEIKKTSLSDATGIDRVTMNDYLLYMQKACLLNLVKPAGAGDGSVRKSEKLLLNNTNIQFAISNNPDLGTTREIFFVNQLTNYFRMQDSFLPVTLEYPKNGDYQIEGRVFEVGGRKKDFRQLKGIDLAYVVSDDIEIGYLNRIPLWLFGMMY